MPAMAQEQDLGQTSNSVIARHPAGPFGTRWAVQISPDGPYRLKDKIDLPGEEIPAGLCQNASKIKGWTDHPNVTNILTFEWSQDGSYSQIIDLTPGAYPFSTLKASERWSGTQLWLVVLKLLSALRHLHWRELVHSAVAPETIYLERDNVRIGEFWWAHNADGDPLYDRWTRHLDPLMWPDFLLPYMAPEMLLGAPPSRQSDIYSLGAVVYYLLTGRSPREASGDTPGAKRSALYKATPTPLLDLRPDIGKKAASFIQQQLHKNPLKRPPMHHLEPMYQYLAGTLEH